MFRDENFTMLKITTNFSRVLTKADFEKELGNFSPNPLSMKYPKIEKIVHDYVGLGKLYKNYPKIVKVYLSTVFPWYLLFPVLLHLRQQVLYHWLLFFPDLSTTRISAYILILTRFCSCALAFSQKLFMRSRFLAKICSSDPFSCLRVSLN